MFVLVVVVRQSTGCISIETVLHGCCHGPVTLLLGSSKLHVPLRHGGLVAFATGWCRLRTMVEDNQNKDMKKEVMKIK